MKAIQVKYLNVTNTKPIRVKAFIEGHSLVETAVCETLEQDALRVAKRLMESLRWENTTITGSGMLPNGDYCITIGDDRSKYCYLSDILKFSASWDKKEHERYFTEQLKEILLEKDWRLIKYEIIEGRDFEFPFDSILASAPKD